MPIFIPQASGGGGAPSGSAGGDLGGSYPNPTVAELSGGGVYIANPAIVPQALGNMTGTAFKIGGYPIIPPAGLRRLPVSALRFYQGTLLAGSAGLAIYSIVFSAAQTFAATKVADLGGAAGTGNIDITTGTNVSKQGDVGPPAGAAAAVTLDFTANTYWICFMNSTAATHTWAGQSKASAIGGFQFSAAVADATGASFPASFSQTSVVALANGTFVPAVWLLTAAGKNLYS